MALTFIKQVDIFKPVIQVPRSPHFEKSLATILCRHQVDKAMKLFALDCLFDDISIIVGGNSPQHDTPSIMDLFHQYSLMMREAASERSPLEVLWYCALFQFKKKDRDGVRIDIRRGTLLFDHLQARKTSAVAGGSLLLREFVRNMKCVLVDRLHARTLKADRNFAKLPLFNPYIRFASEEKGHRRPPGPRQDYGNQFNQRVQVHLRWIMILDTLYGINSGSPCAWMKHQR